MRTFKDGRENLHDEPRSVRLSVITDGLVNAVNEKIREDRRFPISTLALDFLMRVEEFCTKSYPKI